MIGRTFLVAVAIFALASIADAQPQVAIEQGHLTARLGRSAVESAELRNKLQSGLSTTFVLSLRGEAAPAAHPVKGAARIEVRYDLWDEVFIVTLRRGDGTVARERVKSIEALGAWWNDRAIPLAAAAGATAFSGELELRILPFSYSEERDAQGWVSRSLGLSSKGGTASNPAAQSTEGPQQAGMLDALIATSIRAKPISVRRWRVSTGGSPKK